MKTILAGTDFTPSSINACRYAALLAQKLKCKLIIFNMYQTPVYHSNAGLIGLSIPSLKEDSESHIQQIIGNLEQGFPALKISALASPKALSDELEEFIGHHQVAAVVMGLEAKTKLSKFIYGSHGVSISGKINAPVIIVPEKYQKHKFGSIVLAVDNKEKLTASSLKEVEKIMKGGHAHLNLLHVHTPDEVIRRPKAAPVKIAGASMEAKVQNSVSIEAGIKKYCSANEADLVAIISKRHSAFYSLFSEPVTKRVAFSSKIPVIAFHE